jgi:hypothetical protein
VLTLLFFFFFLRLVEGCITFANDRASEILGHPSDVLRPGPKQLRWRTIVCRMPRRCLPLAHANVALCARLAQVAPDEVEQSLTNMKLLSSGALHSISTIRRVQAGPRGMIAVHFLAATRRDERGQAVGFEAIISDIEGPGSLTEEALALRSAHRAPQREVGLGGAQSSARLCLTRTPCPSCCAPASVEWASWAQDRFRRATRGREPQQHRV